MIVDDMSNTLPSLRRKSSKEKEIAAIDTLLRLSLQEKKAPLDSLCQDCRKVSDVIICPRCYPDRWTSYPSILSQQWPDFNPNIINQEMTEFVYHFIKQYHIHNVTLICPHTKLKVSAIPVEYSRHFLKLFTQSFVDHLWPYRTSRQLSQFDSITHRNHHHSSDSNHMIDTLSPPNSPMTIVSPILHNHVIGQRESNYGHQTQTPVGKQRCYQPHNRTQRVGYPIPVKKIPASHSDYNRSNVRLKNIHRYSRSVDIDGWPRIGDRSSSMDDYSAQDCQSGFSNSNPIPISKSFDYDRSNYPRYASYDHSNNAQYSTFPSDSRHSSVIMDVHNRGSVENSRHSFGYTQPSIDSHYFDGYEPMVVEDVDDRISMDHQSNNEFDNRPRKQKKKSDFDLYTPTWVRYQGTKKEGLCDECNPPRWFLLKNSSYWYHKQFVHGISSQTTLQFKKPIETRMVWMVVSNNSELNYNEPYSSTSIFFVLEGKCHVCLQWEGLVKKRRWAHLYPNFETCRDMLLKQPNIELAVRPQLLEREPLKILVGKCMDGQIYLPEGLTRSIVVVPQEDDVIRSGLWFRHAHKCHSNGLVN